MREKSRGFSELYFGHKQHFFTPSRYRTSKKCFPIDSDVFAVARREDMVVCYFASYISRFLSERLWFFMGVVGRGNGNGDEDEGNPSKSHQNLLV